MLKLMSIDDDTDLKKPKKGRPKKSDQNTKSSYVLKNKKVSHVLDVKQSYLVILKINSDDIKLYKTTYCNSKVNLELQPFYKNKIVPLHVSNVPIKLFDEKFSSEDEINTYGTGTGTSTGTYIRNTTNLICPLLISEDGQKWPETSPYMCHNCSCHFSGTPIGIPTRIYKDMIYLKGNYCDFGCMLRRLYDTTNITEFINTYPNICLMYSIIYGLDLNDFELTMALPVTMMGKYGGTLSEQEYHEYHKIHKDRLVDVSQYPFLPSLLRIYNVKIQSECQMNFDKEQRKIKKPEIKEKPYIPIDKEKLERAKETIKRLKEVKK